MCSKRVIWRKIGESRRLYRRGRATALEVDTGSYTNLCDLNRVVGTGWYRGSPR
jgi:hypothetical protein